MSALRRITALYAQPAATRITVAVLTHNRVSQVLDTLAKLVALPDQPRIVLVDNASADGTAERVSQRFPSVQVIKSKVNLGAAGRNLGVERVQTEYVAFCRYVVDGRLPIARRIDTRCSAQCCGVERSRARRRRASLR
jgi:hypothetical protein